MNTEFQNMRCNSLKLTIEFAKEIFALSFPVLVIGDDHILQLASALPLIIISLIPIFYVLFANYVELK